MRTAVNCGLYSAIAQNFTVFIVDGGKNGLKWSAEFLHNSRKWRTVFLDFFPQNSDIPN